MSKFRHGFKAQCEKRSVELRKRLDLDETAPLHASVLAPLFNTSIHSLGEIVGLSDDKLTQLTSNDPDAWSAYTMASGGKHVVVYNPSATPPRINSVCMHELSHIILGHKLANVGMTTGGHLMTSHFAQTDEDEANWLAGVLLLPRPALLSAREKKLSNSQITEEYKVSQEMLTWRVRMSGVDYQMNARRKKYGTR